jgi:hypothetical protein
VLCDNGSRVDGVEHGRRVADERHIAHGWSVPCAADVAIRTVCSMSSINGAQIAHIAAELAAEWRENHPEDAAAAIVLERLADMFSQRKNLDATACLALLAQLEVAGSSEWELIDELRLAIESRVWTRHPSRRAVPETVVAVGAGKPAIRHTS